MEFDTKCSATYKGKNTSLGLIAGHTYEVVVEQKKHGCEISVYYDITIDKEFIKECIPHSNVPSMKANWEFEEDGE